VIGVSIVRVEVDGVHSHRTQPSSMVFRPGQIGLRPLLRTLRGPAIMPVAKEVTNTRDGICIVAILIFNVEM